MEIKDGRVKFKFNRKLPTNNKRIRTMFIIVFVLMFAVMFLTYGIVYYIATLTKYPLLTALVFLYLFDCYKAKRVVCALFNEKMARYPELVKLWGGKN